MKNTEHEAHIRRAIQYSKLERRLKPRVQTARSWRTSSGAFAWDWQAVVVLDVAWLCLCNKPSQLHIEYCERCESIDLRAWTKRGRMECLTCGYVH